MAKRPRACGPARDDVDRALAAAEHALTKLVEIAAFHTDNELRLKSVLTIEQVPGLAVWPLTMAIERVPNEYGRLMLLALIRNAPPGINIGVIATLARVMATDPSEKVRASASETLWNDPRSKSSAGKEIGGTAGSGACNFYPRRRETIGEIAVITSQAPPNYQCLTGSRFF